MRNILRVLPPLILTVFILILIAAPAFTADQPGFQVLVGDWIRTDGGYRIQVKDAKPDGSADVSYFNPYEINISESNVVEWKGLKKLSIKLQDEGYPGSTYTLYYYKEKDALAGFYYQAAMNKKFEVVFVRKK